MAIIAFFRFTILSYYENYTLLSDYVVVITANH